MTGAFSATNCPIILNYEQKGQTFCGDSQAAWWH